MEDTFKFDLNYCLKNGALVGAVFGALNFVLYIVDESLMANGIVGIVSLIAMAVIFGIIGVKYRNDVAGGYMSFGQAFKVLFVTIFTSIIVSTLISIVLFQVVDPDLGGRLMEVTMETTENMMKRFGASQADIDNALADARTRNSFSLQAQLMGILYVGVIGNAVISLILAAIAKKKPEEF